MPNCVHPSVRYFGMFISLSGCQANVPATTTYSQNNVLQHSKRSVTSALVIGFGGIGGVLASTVVSPLSLWP